ncbi:PEGA domain-containing protein [Verrucomicrobiota bacterium]
MRTVLLLLSVSTVVLAVVSCRTAPCGGVREGPHELDIRVLGVEDRMADVYIDGSFVGSTHWQTRSLQVHLAAGDHELMVTDHGYVPWRRTIRILDGSRSQRVDVLLQKAGEAAGDGEEDVAAEVDPAGDREDDVVKAAPDCSKLELRGNGHTQDSFSLAVAAAASYLRKRMPLLDAEARSHVEAASRHYDEIAALLGLATWGFYRDILDDAEKQAAHVEAVLKQVKAELAAAADEMEKALLAMGEDRQTRSGRSESSACPSIGHLRTRDKLITIRTGPDGPLWTVRSDSGAVLAEDLSAAALSAKFPELRDVVEGGIADWAGISPEHQVVRVPADVATGPGREAGAGRHGSVGSAARPGR